MTSAASGVSAIACGVEPSRLMNAACPEIVPPCGELKTLVTPFSARPAPGAPVSVPIRWDELDDPDLRPDRWTIRTVLARLAETGDPLGDLVGRPQRLPTL